MREAPPQNAEEEFKALQKRNQRNSQARGMGDAGEFVLQVNHLDTMHDNNRAAAGVGDPTRGAQVVGIRCVGIRGIEPDAYACAWHPNRRTRRART